MKKLYIVWNEDRTEGFATFDKQLAYETRKSASSNCYSEDGERRDLAIAFCDLFYEGNCTMETVEI
jgi:hypothetical protein